VNHCFADVERFMGRLQMTAVAKNDLEQRSMKKSRKKNSKKNKKQDGERDDIHNSQTLSRPSETS